MTTTSTYLERIDAARNMARYYRLSVVKTLFGEWAVVREWGRIGRGGQSREEWCASIELALHVHAKRVRARKRRGYRSAQNAVYGAG